jgi:hypothetical protein
LLNIVVIGSAAVDEYIPNHRPIGDVDIIGRYDDVIAYFKFMHCTSIYPVKGNKVIGHGKGVTFEAEIAWPNTTSEWLFEYVKKSDCIREDIGDFTHHYTPLYVCYALKMSHRFLKDSPHFRKTMDDILFLQGNLGKTEVHEDLKEWYRKRTAETYDYSLPNLNQNKKAFFDNSNNIYSYNHDDIHEAVKIFPKPAYQYYSTPGQEVLSSQERFRECGRLIQIAGVVEESCVLAIERCLEPFPGMKTPRQAYEMALEKVCTSITSGWFREFAWNNYHSALAVYPANYFERFIKALTEGRIRRFDE